MLLQPHWWLWQPSRLLPLAEGVAAPLSNATLALLGALLVPAVAAAAAASAAARAAAAVLAAVILRYCMAADMALATRGGALGDSRDSFLLRSSLAESSSVCSDPFKPPADAAEDSAEEFSALGATLLAACAPAAAAPEARLYSRALYMRAAASLALAPPLLFAFIRS